MIEFRADLHCHTTCSDGTSSPKQVIDLAKSIGLSGLSITDHDTLESYAEAFSYASEQGIRLLPGVELSTVHKGASIHVLAYAFSYPSQILQGFCKIHHEKRITRNLEIIQLLNKHGMPLTFDEVKNAYFEYSGKSATLIQRPHIALAMLKKGYVSSIPEAFNLYIGEEKPCFVPGSYHSVEETIDTIHEAGGLAVIAHPHLIMNQRIVNDLSAMKFDGLEAYYACLTPLQEKRWIKLAQKKGWLITGGSDYHGAIKPNIPLGASWVGQETFDYLYSHFQFNTALKA